MATLGDFGYEIYNTFCTTLGCGGDVGFLFAGIFMMVMFTLIIYKMNLGLDAVLVVGSMILITMAGNSLIHPQFEPIVFMVLGLLIGSALYVFWRR